MGSLCKRHAVTTRSGSDRLWAHDFRVSFTPLSGVLFTFPSRYWFAIGLSVVFSLAGWSPRVRPGFLVSRLTQVPPRPGSGFRLRGSHPLRPRFPAGSASLSRSLHWRSYNPARRPKTPAVWAPALSLAATRAITFVFSSSGYLDVSVPRVRPRHKAGAGIAPGGLPHSETRASTGICPSARNIAACRVLLRLREPRHPSCALLSFPFIFFSRAGLGRRSRSLLVSRFEIVRLPPRLRIPASRSFPLFRSSMSMCSLFRAGSGASRLPPPPGRPTGGPVFP